MVRGSPRLLAYQPVIYVKILAKKRAQGGKGGKTGKEKKSQQRKASKQGSSVRDWHNKAPVL